VVLNGASKRSDRADEKTGRLENLAVCRHVPPATVPHSVPQGFSGPQLAPNKRWYRGNPRRTGV